ncbi:MAG TPA: 2-phospho-L-lactate transferase [Solirubrobacteraceae bacterium]|jgi:LPPG:FO 2-phospho-L-lactate transferase|nr:2-phospho-L-lactate transferase [Solirubrobacteraceae bacterium]
MSEGGKTDGSMVILAGGTGGAKLARGILDVLDTPEHLTVIANTGDDIEIYGAHVSPDPDLVSFWLADLIDARGWGLRDDTFAVMDGLRELGHDVWFHLGDRDLAWCMRRARMLIEEELSPTAALARLNEAIGVRAHVLPMSDDPVRTWVRSPTGWCSFQEFMIRERAQGIIEGLEFRGAEDASPSEQALVAIAGASAIVIGPSNPLASIAPILAVPGIREAIAGARAPVVAVSPVVGGQILKGPTAAFMAFAALECNADGIADFYGDLLDGIVADENVARLPTLQIDTRMDDSSARARVARQTLDFAAALAG